MREQLRQLQDAEKGTVLTVRKIQYLGFSAPTHLEEHFKTFGPVSYVLVPQSHVRSSFLPSGIKKRQATIRQRPAHLGFVIMGTPAAAQAAFDAGSQHTIGEASVILEPFDEARWKTADAEEQP